MAKGTPRKKQMSPATKVRGGPKPGKSKGTFKGGKRLGMGKGVGRAD